MLTAAQLAALHTTLKARFNAGLALTKEEWRQVAGYITSSSKSNTYAWLTQFPAFREWVGSRLHKAVAEMAYTVPNRKFEATIDIPRTEIEDDDFGHYGDVASGYGQSVRDLQNDLIFQAIKNGFSSLCYDGQYFFDTDHPVYANEDGTGAVTPESNMQAGVLEPWVLMCTERAPKAIYMQERIKPQFDAVTSANNPNVFDLDVYSFGGRWRGAAAYGFWQLAQASKAALTAANFNDAFKAMEKRKGDGGRLLGVSPDLLVVGPDNRVAAEQLLKARDLAGGGSNTNYEKVKLVVTPWLAL